MSSVGDVVAAMMGDRVNVPFTRMETGLIVWVPDPAPGRRGRAGATAICCGGGAAVAPATTWAD